VDIRNDNAILISPTKYLKNDETVEYKIIHENTFNHIPEYILINLTSKKKSP
jgi:hypothetical protein